MKAMGKIGCSLLGGLSHNVEGAVIDYRRAEHSNGRDVRIGDHSAGHRGSSRWKQAHRPKLCSRVGIQGINAVVIRLDKKNVMGRSVDRQTVDIERFGPHTTVNWRRPCLPELRRSDAGWRQR